jgi:hypothetical protein
MAGRLLDTLTSADRDGPAIWLDAVDYTRQVILNGAPVPWFDGAAFIAFEREIHSLLKADVATFDVERFYSAVLTVNSELCASMAGKKRLGFALKTLLAAPGPRDQQLELLRGLRASFSERPLVLLLPSPRRWIGLAHGVANGLETVDVSLEDAESGAVYVADFLNHFSDAGIDGVLLVETPGSTFDANEQLSAYQPILNVAEHYRWDTGLLAIGAEYASSQTDPIAYCITDGTPLASVHAAVLASDYWRGTAPPALGDATFYYGRIPADAVPEMVLEQVAKVRA